MNVLEVRLAHPLRPVVEEHITGIYRRAFGAEVTQFAPRIVAGLDAAAAVRCAAGIRSGAEAFHSECYLERPAEQAASAALSRPVHRSELLEFTSLACARPGDALNFISAVVDMGRGSGCRIALFTATAPLRKLLRRAGLTVIPIAPAEVHRVADPDVWGRYYDADPFVCVAPDSPSVPKALRAPCFQTGQVVPLVRGVVQRVRPSHA